MNLLEKEKELAAIGSLVYIEDNMLLGLGTGSTVYYLLKHLAKSKIKIKGAVPSSKATETLAIELGIPLISLDTVTEIDLNIDGADEFDEKFRLIKGGGGALLREKVIAYNSKKNIIIADSTKRVKKLGKFKLPVEVIPFASKNIQNRIHKMGIENQLRIKNGETYTTDQGNYILDLDIFRLENYQELEQKLISIPGLVETGLFLNSSDTIIMGLGEKVEIFNK